MADSFGLKIGLEGEKEFKKALAEINQSFKVLGSEMKLATSQFDKNDKSVEALAARNKVLRKEIDEQTTKIDTLRKALQNAATLPRTNSLICSLIISSFSCTIFSDIVCCLLSNVCACNFILPEPASYVFFYAVFNLRKLLYIIL